MNQKSIQIISIRDHPFKTSALFGGGGGGGGLKNHENFADVLNGWSLRQVQTEACVCCRPCNPSKWEADFEDDLRSGGLLHFTA